MTRKVSLFVHDLAGNPVVRAYPLAIALRHLGFDVELLGYLISGPQVYEPYRDRIPTHALNSTGRLSNILLSARHLADMADGDIIYAFKPLWTSYYPALLASHFARRKPLLLDIEDNELWINYKGIIDFANIHFIRGWNYAGALKYNWLLHPLTKLSVGNTVVSRKLQQRYGGTILLHGPDERVFDPSRIDLDPRLCRQNWALPKAAFLLLFAGTPHPHKGLEDVVKALAQPEMSQFELVLAGNPSHPGFQHAAKMLMSRCHLLGVVDNSKMPELLSAVDIVPTIQRHNGYTEAQIPAKLLEAMAMGKLVVASNVGDLSDILGVDEDKPRGWIVPPENPHVLANLLREIAADPVEAQRRGETARQYYLEHASTAAIARTLEKILANISAS